MNKISIGVIGAGHLGSRHAHTVNCLKGARLSGICDLDSSKAKLANELNCGFFNDFSKLLPISDALIVAVPTKSHFEVGAKCLEAGKHVLIEKPITSDVRQADKLIKTAKKHKLVLQVGHIERFNNAFRAVSEILTEPKFIECHRLSPFPARSLDIGVVSDLMIHDIDLILGLVRSEVVSIEAVGINVLTHLEDIANVRISFKNGCITNLTASRISAESMRKFRIFQRNAYISLDYKNNSAQVFKKQNASIVKEDLATDQVPPLQQELESFVECISQGKKPVVSGQEAREALDLAIKIQRKINSYIKNIL